MKNFSKSIPDSITESAKIDGAGDFDDELEPHV